MMICSEVKPLLDLLCDGVLPAKDSALVLDHLRSCDQCQAEWNELEQLRSRFLEAKQKIQLPAGLMDKISDQLRNEIRDNRKRVLDKYSPPLMAVAAAFAFAGFVVIPWLRHNTYPASTSSNLALGANTSVESLIENFRSNGAVEPVADRKQLGTKVGYPLKYLRLPAWRLAKAGVYRSPSVAVARFDFVKGQGGGLEQFTCYQAPAGAINAKMAEPREINGKHVLIGNRGDLQFALWTQDERDYLFVTRLPQSALEEIIGHT
jgi:hypothetical protein